MNPCVLNYFEEGTYPPRTRPAGVGLTAGRLHIWRLHGLNLGLDGFLTGAANFRLGHAGGIAISSEFHWLIIFLWLPGVKGRLPPNCDCLFDQ